MKVREFAAWLIVASLVGYASGMLHFRLTQEPAPVVLDVILEHDSFADCSGNNVRSILECYGDE